MVGAPGTASSFMKQTVREKEKGRDLAPRLHEALVLSGQRRALARSRRRLSVHPCQPPRVGFSIFIIIAMTVVVIVIIIYIYMAGIAPRLHNGDVASALSYIIRHVCDDCGWPHPVQPLTQWPRVCIDAGQ